MTVRSPKTEHHAGGESRVVPLFPELRPLLEAVFDEAEPGTEYVITRYRNTNANLRTQLERILHRAGVNPWPKPFHNLRATRETELAETFPLARSLPVDWQLATNRPSALSASDRQALRTGGAESGAVGARNGPQRFAERRGRARKTPGFAGVCERLRTSEHLSSGG